MRRNPQGQGLLASRFVARSLWIGGYTFFTYVADITDVHPESICWPFFGIEAKPSLFMIPGSYHNRRGIMTWSDGHVEARRWADDRTTGAIPDEKSESSSANYWHMHEHASPGNPDLKWLKAHTLVLR
ncbi:MAG: hypothetical protein FJ398_18170 [Verrucomicrobia bacterium]|nr:hypothetical protein [Verrucomicrobiota bacterium]